MSGSWRVRKKKRKEKRFVVQRQETTDKRQDESRNRDSYSVLVFSPALALTLLRQLHAVSTMGGGTICKSPALIVKISLSLAGRGPSVHHTSFPALCARARVCVGGKRAEKRTGAEKVQRGEWRGCSFLQKMEMSRDIWLCCSCALCCFRES